MSDDGTSWLEIAQLIGLVVTVVFAAVAAKQARDTVRETKAMRREERLAELPELVADVGTHLADITHNVVTAPRRLEIARPRLEAALDATGEALPECRKLLDVQTTQADPHEKALEVVRPAFNELRALLVEAASK